VDDQVDGAASAAVTVPVEELAPGDGDCSLCCVPAGFVLGIGPGADAKQHRWQGDGAKSVGMISG
jgi:hypothetical protein